ncbi:uncharacterized protein LOC111717035, partial [Eurytemora carolleeae]|uniref:uncharacterized protein LOC111717035 n=1 Tax=Eurytemora carolleeae TaxID=1294199 RepID=UPI000C75E4D2
MPYVWVSELGSLDFEDHTPDHVISVHPSSKCVILTILGTRIFPRPSPQDIIMDLAAKTIKFDEGEAHCGMAMGARNLLKTSREELTNILNINPGCTFVILGYSLGAGIAQLVAYSLLSPEYKNLIPDGIEVRTVLYGCPPVYGSSTSIPQLKNVLVVQNHNDGICGASLKSINDVFLKTRAIHRLNLKRRTLFRMVLTSSSGKDKRK